MGLLEGPMPGTVGLGVGIEALEGFRGLFSLLVRCRLEDDAPDAVFVNLRFQLFEGGGWWLAGWLLATIGGVILTNGLGLR